MMDLYETYSRWTGLLHFWAIKHLNQSLNVEFFPSPDWKIALYAGSMDYIQSLNGIPSFRRSANTPTIQLPRPEDNPTEDKLNEVFKQICIQAAVLLGFEPRKLRLPDGAEPETIPPVQTADEPSRSGNLLPRTKRARRATGKNRKSRKKGTGNLRKLVPAK